jgi:hypothetical protein|tara:strand:- start:96 stop:317 length:222 start_codon:yes stop_codon:yes gene_type:complete
MKTIIDNETKISMRLIDDDSSDTFNTFGIPEGSATWVEDVESPENYDEYKYKYIDNAWVLDATYVDPNECVVV